MVSLAVVLLTYNEEKHLGRALDSIRGIASEIFVIDSGSKDGTVRIAQEAGATVLTNPFVNQAVQFQWAMDNIRSDAEWMMRLDADEVIEPDLAENLMRTLPTLPADVTGIRLQRKHIYMGRWIKHGGRFPLELLRVWRKGAARVENRWMDEHMLLSHGREITVPGGFADINLGDLAYFVDKHNKYATREAVQVLNVRHHLYEDDDAMTETHRGQASGKRKMKEQLYNRLPFAAGPVLYFLYRYIVQLGFLDGPEGAIYHGLQGLWYRFLVDAKVMEFEQKLSDCTTPEQKLRRLESLTGLSLSGPA